MKNFPVSVEKLVRWLFVLLAIYVLVSVTALFYSRDYISIVTKVAPRLFMIFLLATAVIIFLKTIRWLLLVRILDASISISDAARMYIGGISMIMTLGRMGKLWRAWVLAAKFGTGYRSGVPIVVADKLLDLNALLIFASFGFFFSPVFQWFALVCLAVFLPPVLLCFKPRWAARMVKIAWLVVGKRFPRKFAGMLAILRNLGMMTRPSVYLPAFAITMVAWLIEAITLSIVASGLGGELPLAAAMSSLGLANIVGVMTFLPGGVGGHEATMILLIRESGNNLPVAVAVSGIARICSLFIPALLGVPFFMKMTRRKPALAR